MTRKKLKRKRIVREEDETPEKKVKLKYKLTSRSRKRRQRSSSGSPSNVIIVIFAISIVVVVGVILASPSGTSQGDNPIEYQISYSVTTIHEETIELSTYQGKSLIIYFSGVTCPPCQLHLPYLVDAYNYYKSGEIGMVSLDIGGSSIEALLEWEQNNGITWKVCQDSGLTLSTYFSVYSMPTLVVCDENGYELNRYIGAQTNETIWAIVESMIN